MPDGSKGRKLAPLPGAKETTFEVGYSKPPVKTRFKPWKSGNPRGRPKGTKNIANSIPAMNEERLKQVILEEAYRSIGVRDGDRLVEIPVIQAIIRSVALNAAKGHQGSQRMFTHLLQLVERENKAWHDEWLQTAIEYKVDWERELERRQNYGETGPEPIPHPDDIVINLNTGQVEIHGPVTKEEKVFYDWLRAQKVQSDDLIADLEKMASKKPHDKTIQENLARQRRLRARVAAIVPD